MGKIEAPYHTIRIREDAPFTWRMTVRDFRQIIAESWKIRQLIGRSSFLKLIADTGPPISKVAYRPLSEWLKM